jgi:predicted metal-dependent HD superfamily phosphohydrolase
MFERGRWLAAWRGLGAKPPVGLLVDLIARYAEPGRFYHTLQHLGECFAALDCALHLAERPSELELAIWFHDAIHDTRALDNEERSAAWVEEVLLGAGAPVLVAGRVCELILATKHADVPAERDARLLIDVDLCILGQADERYSEYELQVRREFGWVTDEAFRQGRADVLRSFLERPSVFTTSWFAERLETRARANLSRSLRELTV